MRSSLLKIGIASSIIAVIAAWQFIEYQEGKTNNSNISSTKEDIIARYTGGFISKEEADMLLKKYFGKKVKEFTSFDQMDSAMQNQLISEIVAQKIISEKAQKFNIEEDPAIQAKLDAYKAILIREAFIKQQAENSVKAKDVEQKYEKMVKALENKDEVRVRHILIRSENKARDLLWKLRKDPDQFSAVAKRHSRDASRSRGGDIGYILPGEMAREFERVAFSIKIGAISNPVKTKFGWHIIKVEDRRPASLIPYAIAKKGIRRSLVEQAKSNYVESLLDEAEIVVETIPVGGVIEKPVDSLNQKHQ